MSHHYPYPSILKEQMLTQELGRDYFIWEQDPGIKTLVTQKMTPIIEIGGPTTSGFFFLDNIPLPEKPLITNISKNPAPYSEDAQEIAAAVDEIVDGKDMKYDDESVGIFLMSYMSHSSDWWVELSDQEKDAASQQFDTEFLKAMLEMGQMAIGVKSPNDVKFSQRVMIYREVFRTLKHGGLFFTNGDIEEIDILKLMGFKLAAFLQMQDEHACSYEFVVIKP
jgi:hypothetical protein